jgi:hypothetical protein
LNMRMCALDPFLGTAEAAGVDGSAWECLRALWDEPKAGV